MISLYNTIQVEDHRDLFVRLAEKIGLSEETIRLFKEEEKRSINFNLEDARRFFLGTIDPSKARITGDVIRRVVGARMGTTNRDEINRRILVLMERARKA